MAQAREDKKELLKAKAELMEMTTAFCGKYLDEEYQFLCEALIEKMARKRVVPFMSGRREIWAAAVVYAIGSMNFLFDKSFEPYVTTEQIAEFFRASKSTLRQKAALIRDMFKMQPFFNTEFATRRTVDQNPLMSLAVVDGFLVPINKIF
jgi:hypothetical protein